MWKVVRKVFQKIHLYAGLTAGLVVIAVCLSGTIYVYNTEIREWSDKDRYVVKPGSERVPLDHLKTQLESSLEGEVTSVQIYGSEDRSVIFSLKRTEEELPINYYVDPYTGDILASNKDKTTAETWMGYMFSLHRWLLLDQVKEPILSSMSNMELGRLINGIATMLFLIGVLTGIVIWFPQKINGWRQGLKIKWSGNWKRINHDLHNTLAFYSLVFLFIMSVTGPFWSFQWYKEGWQKTWDTFQAPKSEPKAEIEAPKLPTADFSLDEVFSKTQAQLSYPGNVRISIPPYADEPISVSKSRTGFWARAGADQLSFEQSRLELVEAKLFADLSFRQQIGRSVKSLHTGEIFGQATKFVWFLACLVATSLPITGTLIWWNRRTKKKQKRSRRMNLSQKPVLETSVS
ncbi:putative iron-regulated membrane protein [Mariniradius saccharolyticus AK6]|uniref:Iron-regulated membrane protein n=1 Tax=Mariniradius saccharolyticus AK6 TaxID=1239962 RepID=M7X5N4_9BACT|nr:PepSY-associated TM helix domain-containing protein [Mariniradius saccharolyticus]EMS32760.1 putative iron-regulated membrane protein [Mariniradius saccharolyticus AK6]